MRRGKGCIGCGGFAFVRTVDNLGCEYPGCSRCRVLSAEELAARSVEALREANKREEPK